MDSVFSVDEISDQFWSPPIPTGKDESSKMNRSASEWAFQRFLQEASSVASDTSHPPPSSDPDNQNDDLILEIKQPPKPKQDLTAPTVYKNGAVLPNEPPPNISVDSEHYQAILKSKLNLACAAVALTRVLLFFMTRSTLDFIWLRDSADIMKICGRRKQMIGLDLYWLLIFVPLALSFKFVSGCCENSKIRRKER